MYQRDHVSLRLYSTVIVDLGAMQEHSNILRRDDERKSRNFCGRKLSMLSSIKDTIKAMV